MRCRFYGNKPLGADLTVKEKRCLDIEVEKALRKQLEKVGDELDAAVLKILNEEFGFGIVRLRRFHRAYQAALRRVWEYYDLEDGAEQWLALRWLKEKGYDFEGENGED